jgi:hypothetical protein
MELASPVYFIKNMTHHISFPQQVDPRSKMEVDFRTGINQDTLGGVLLYHLQRKEKDESDTDKDASTSTQLLVIWGWNSYKFYSHAWLIEHESTLDFDIDKLRMLYNTYDDQYNGCFNAEKWLLNDNTGLKTKCELLHGYFKMEVIVSEEKDLNWSIEPLWIDSNR